jgi:hypothetical protein
MKTKKPRFRKKITPLFFGILLAAQAVSTSFMPIVSAAVKANDMNIVQQTQSWWFYRAVGICLNQNNTIPVNWNWAKEDIETGNWIDDQSPGDNFVYGQFMREVISDMGTDGQASCRGTKNQVLTEAFSFWQIDPLELICGDPSTLNDDILYRADHQSCYDGANDFDEVNPIDYPNRPGFRGLNTGPEWGNRRDVIMGRIKQAVYPGQADPSSIRLDGSMEKGPMRYIYYLGSFKNGCAYGASGTIDRPGAKYVYEISEYDEATGTSGTLFYAGDKSPTSNVRVWTGGEQMTCQELADALAPSSNALSGAYEAAVVANPTSGGGIGSSTDTDGAQDLSDGCPLPAEASMRWLGCSIFFTLQDTATALGNQINNYLYADTDTMFGTSAQNAATTFRNIGMVIIVIAGLFMVISQALGFEFLDAYTIRKLMPRLGIALIGMALSWPLLKLAVTLTNDLGGLVSSILLGIAGDVNPTSTSSADGGTNLGVAITGLVGVSTVAIGLGVAGFLSLLGTVALALIIGLLVLSVRQLVIFMAILIAPLAIAAYVVPGGQKLWGFWKNTLITTLFMYPLIMGFIAAGAAMSYIIPKTTNELQILAIIVYFAPFFMLPFAFKMVGGLMGTIFSIANDKNKGGFDRLKKKRQGIREDRIGRAKNNSLWDPNSKIQKALGANKWASVMTDPYGNLAHAGRNIPGLRKKGSSIEASINSQRTQQTGKLFEELNNMFGNNDKAYRLLSGAHSGLGLKTREKLKEQGLYGKRITSLNDLQAAAKILGESDEGSERLAGNAIHNASGRLATLNQDPEMLRADVTAAGMMGLAAHGFASGDDLAYTGNLLQKSGMSAGAAQSMVVQAQVMGARGRPDLKAGYGIVYNGKTGQFENGMNADGSQNRAKELIMSLSSGDLAGAKTGAFQALEPHIAEIIHKGGDPARAVQEQIFSWAGQYSQASADTKAETLRFIRNNGLEAEFDKYNRAYDPEKAGAGAPVAEPPVDNNQGAGI